MKTESEWSISKSEILSTDRRGFIRKTALCTLSSLCLSHKVFSSSVDSSLKTASYFDRLENKKIKCRLCPHECQVADLERGTCGVRENRNGIYYSLVYQQLCTAHVDPIEKKPLFHYLPGTKSYSIATAGCNFICKFCQNWEISQKRPEQIKSVTVSADTVIQNAVKTGCRTIAHTYTEPVVFFETVNEYSIAGKKKGIPNIMISNGYIQKDPMKELCRTLGAVKIDLKAFTENFYRDICGGSLKPVLDTLKTVKEEGVWLEIVVLLIPSLNDSKNEIHKMTKWIVNELGPDVPIHFSRYFPTFMMKNIPPTPLSTLYRARDTALENGIHYAYIGNMISDAENTFCPSCGELLIERIGHNSLIKGMVKNQCRKCNTVIPGYF